MLVSSPRGNGFILNLVNWFKWYWSLLVDTVLLVFLLPVFCYLNPVLWSWLWTIEMKITISTFKWNSPKVLKSVRRVTLRLVECLLISTNRFQDNLLWQIWKLLHNQSLFFHKVCGITVFYLCVCHPTQYVSLNKIQDKINAHKFHQNSLAYALC